MVVIDILEYKTVKRNVEFATMGAYPNEEYKGSIKKPPPKPTIPAIQAIVKQSKLTINNFFIDQFSRSSGIPLK